MRVLKGKIEEIPSGANENPPPIGVKPVPMPKPKNLIKSEEIQQPKVETKKSSDYEELDTTNPFNDDDVILFTRILPFQNPKTTRSSSVDSDIVAKLAEASINIDPSKQETTPQVKARAPPPRPPPPSADRVSVIIQKQQEVQGPTTPTHRVSVIIESKEEVRQPNE